MSCTLGALLLQSLQSGSEWLGYIPNAKLSYGVCLTEFNKADAELSIHTTSGANL